VPSDAWVGVKRRVSWKPANPSRDEGNSRRRRKRLERLGFTGAALDRLGVRSSPRTAPAGLQRPRALGDAPRRPAAVVPPALPRDSGGASARGRTRGECRSAPGQRDRADPGGQRATDALEDGCVEVDKVAAGRRRAVPG